MEMFCNMNMIKSLVKTKFNKD